MNAREEFEERFKGLKVIAAEIILGGSVERIIYKVGDNFEEFLKKLDFEYDNGYGGQELFGCVWFEDGVWAERGEYDGSEWWEVKIMPEIPEDLR